MGHADHAMRIRGLSPDVAKRNEPRVQARPVSFLFPYAMKHIETVFGLRGLSASRCVALHVRRA